MLLAFTFLLLCLPISCQDNTESFVYLHKYRLTVVAGRKTNMGGWMLRGGNSAVDYHDNFVRIPFEDVADSLNYFRALSIGRLKTHVRLQFRLQLSLEHLPEPATEGPWDRIKAGVGIVRAADHEWNGLFYMTAYRSANQYYGICRLTNTDQESVYIDPFPIPDTEFELIVDFDMIEGTAEFLVDGERMAYMESLDFGDGFLEYVSIGVSFLSSFTGTAGGHIDLFEANIYIARVEDLYVDCINGNDQTNDGKSEAHPFKTITATLPYLSPGTTVHIARGVYRGEQLQYFVSGNPDEAVVFQKLEENSKVILSGGFLADNFVATPSSPGDTHFLDFSGAPTEMVLTDSPKIVVELSANGEDIIDRYNISQYPNYIPPALGKEYDPYFYFHIADGGASINSFKPDWENQVNPSVRSNEWLTFENSFWPNTIDAVSFCDNTHDLVGASITVLDGNSGHYTYQRTIVEHDSANCRVRVDADCLFDGETNALGATSQFILYNKLDFLQQPREYFYDSASERLYIYPSSGNPDWSTIEIQSETSTVGFNLQGISNVIIDGLSIRLFERAIKESGGYGDSWTVSHNITVRNCEITHCDYGIYIHRGMDHSATLRNWRIEHNVITFIDTLCIYVIMGFTQEVYDAHPSIGISQIYLVGNYIYFVGFNSGNDNRNGLSISDADHWYLADNYFKRISHNGIHFSKASKKTNWDPDDPERVPCCNVVYNNTFDASCSGNCDCGGLKIWGPRELPNAVFDRFFVMNNVAINNFGSCFASYIQGKWWGENDGQQSSDGRATRMSGLGAWGYYVDRAAGIWWYRNIAINNGYAGMSYYMYWEMGNNVIYNNLFADSKFGLHLGARTLTSDTSIRNEVKNNVFLRNYRFGFKCDGKYGEVGMAAPFREDLLVDNNLYYDCGLRTNSPWKNKGLVCVHFDNDFACVQNYINETSDLYESYPNFDDWERNSLSINPDFSISPEVLGKLESAEIVEITREEALELWETSKVLIDRGTSELPSDLLSLLDYFEICDPMKGEAFDIGPRENGLAKYEIGKGCPPGDLNNRSQGAVAAIVITILCLLCFFCVLLAAIIGIIVFVVWKRGKDQAKYTNDDVPLGEKL